MVATAFTGLGAFNAFAQESAGLVEGKQYQRLTPAQPTMSGDGAIEVAEVFMYSCPACYSLEPHLAKWVATKPDNVTFVRIPASFNPLAKVHAQAYYTAEALGKAEEIDAAFFDEFHQKRNSLDTEAALVDFFERFGVDEATFKQTFNSFAVHAKVRRSDELVRRYRVPGTPAIVVNGKYLTSGSMAGSYDGWFQIVNELVATEQAN
jgi:thiol:disulfide interchange protein DsbA